MFMIPTIAVLTAALLLFPLFRSGNTPKARKRVAANAGVFLIAAVLMVTMAMGVFAAPAEAAQTAEMAEQAAQQAVSGSNGLGFLAAALSTGLSCLGAGIAIASTAPAAIGAFSEDPKAFGKALIFVVLGEGVALYGLLISILLINKL